MEGYLFWLYSHILERNKMRGKFIVVEGPDGAGKTTLVNNLVDLLKKQGIKTIKTREPGGSSIGADIRRLLFDKTRNMDNVTNALLVSAERRHHLQTLVEPYLDQGYWVICDRYILSTYVYQGMNEQVRTIVKEAVREHRLPDLTFLLFALPGAAIDRLIKRGDLNHFDALTPEEYNERINQYNKVPPEEYTQVVETLLPVDWEPDDIAQWALTKLELRFGECDTDGCYALMPQSE
jgi:dTMP kinase